MFLIRHKKLLPALMLAFFLLVALLPGCGLRQSKTGSLSSRVIDADGNAVVNAEVFSIFAESEKVYTASDGAFYLSEIPAGINNIVIIHPDFALEERQVEISSSKATVVEFIKLDRSNAPNRISNVKVNSVASTSVEISWSTYRSVICNVDYGVTQSYGSIYREQRPATEHVAELTGLTPETLYHFRVQYIDENSVSYYSYDLSFRTDRSDRPYSPEKLLIKPMKAQKTVELEWADLPGRIASGYNIYRSEGFDEWQKLNDLPLGAKSSSFADIAAEPGAFYRYAVVAVDDLGAESEKTISETVFVPGIITRNVSLRASDSPVKVYADLIISSGAHFEVEAGTQFQISSSDAFASGKDEQRIEITVHGRIALVGTSENPIVFSPMEGDGRRDHWAGIRILSHLTGICDLSHVKIFGCNDSAVYVKADRVRLGNLQISYCLNGLSLEGLRDYLELDSCSFSEISDTALSINRCRRILLNNSNFNSVGRAVYNFTDYPDDQILIKNTDISCINTGIAGKFGKLRFLNLLIIAPDGTGIDFEDAFNRVENYVDHCTIDAMKGIVVRSGEFIIENNVISNRSQNGLIGINNTSILSPDYSYNNIYGFSEAYEGCQGGIGALQTDPKYVGGNPFSYRLQADSTLKLQDRYGSELGKYGNTRY